MKAKYNRTGLILLFLIFIHFFLKAEIITEYAEKHREIAFRNIGHQVLLSTGDSTSRVLPIKKLSENLYQIEFQSQFSFVDDTLINLVEKLFKVSKLPNEYIVSVLNCDNQKIVFGYEVNSKTGNTIPCTGRSQPKGCYTIQIEFLNEKETINYAYFLLLIPFGFIAYFIKQKVFSEQKIDKIIENELFTPLGIFKFNPQSNFLLANNNKIELTEKESKLLTILLKNTNITTDRELLMSEIWGNDGLIVVGRSLDVLVSKLRKKLEADPQIKIQNVHGKGYKLVL